jgi:transcriptional regulator with XRE-family HTH domain
LATYNLNIATLRRAATRAGDDSLYQIHKRTGIDRSTLGRCAKGQTAPSVETLVRLSQTYGVPIEELLQNEQAAVA